MKKARLKKQYLFCPGPVNVAQNVKEAVVECEIGHREDEFSAIVRRLQKKILQVFEVKNTRRYLPIIVTGSGTAANESVLSSIVGDKHILVLVNGEFGERLAEISSIHNPNTHILRFKWAASIDVKRVENYLKRHHIDVVAVVHHETCTGMLNPIDKIGKLAKKYDAQFFVDAVSSAGAEKIDMEKWYITFCSTSSSKALASLPGLSIVVGEKRAFEALKHMPVRTSYLNLYKFYFFAKQQAQTPNTPAVQLFYALEQALTNILQDGIKIHRQKIAMMATTLRAGMKKMGLSFLIDEKDMSSVLTTVRIPSYTDLAILRNKLKEKSFIVYNGKGPFKDKVFQVGNIGELSKDEIDIFLRELHEILLASRTIDTFITPITTLTRRQVVTPRIPQFVDKLEVAQHGIVEKQEIALEDSPLFPKQSGKSLSYAKIK